MVRLLRHTLLLDGMTMNSNRCTKENAWDFNNDIDEADMEISVHQGRLIATMQATYAS